jgi:superfamily I DNA and/or RNA helicase/ribulose bisphosphate carboxylase small subunit
MGEIAASLSKAIKEGKWISIDYQNKEGEITSYWCAITDIDITTRKITVDAFNAVKIDNDNKGVLLNAFLYFDNIQSARVLDHTAYQRPNELLEKIEKNLDQLEWLKFDLYNEQILDYIKDCLKFDSVPYQKETALVSAIDHEALIKSSELGYYTLSLAQLAEIAEKIEKISKQDKQRQFKVTELALNLLSINTERGLFVCVYKNLLFNPAERQLILDENIQFNYEFASDENESYRHNLRNYLDMEVDDFTELFKTQPDEAKDMLSPSLNRFREFLDDCPYIMDLVRPFNGYIDKEFEAIASSKKANELSIPLLAFFGNMDIKYKSRKRLFDIVLLDNKMNVDQLRVIHNALKQPITYVQGPPGTGKTKSIINLLISTFFNEQKVLVSSNNNKPIDDIYLKLKQLKSKNTLIPLPVLRLGNNEKVKESIITIKEYMKQADLYEIDEEKLQKIGISNKKSMKDINEIIDHYESRIELEEEVDILSSMNHELTHEIRSSIIIQTELEKKQNELKEIPHYTEEDIHQHVVKANESFLMWLFFTSIKFIKHLKEPKYKEFVDILNIENEEEQIRLFNQYLHEQEHLKLILRVFPIVMTTNQSAYRLGEPEPSFDLTIIDEAGQCSIGHALFPIIRGKRLLLVGDQNQLRPVITLSPESNAILMRKHHAPKSYDYVNNSIIKNMQTMDSISKFVLLRYHYRCHKDIIEFSNQKYYHKQLKVPDRQGFDKQALFYLDIDQKKIPRSNERNTSLAEVDSIIADIRLKKSESIGIITPFRNQAEIIKERVAQEGLSKVDVGTIHTFQGDEKEIIYFSSAITSFSSPKTFDWIKNNEELLNVATTRAQNEFVMVGDYNEIKKRSGENTDLLDLFEYTKKNGKEVKIVSRQGDANFNGIFYRQYDTKKEQELLSTVSQILSFGGKYKIETQVKVADILKKYNSDELLDYGIKAVFDFVISQKLKSDTIPRLVIELNGDEHLNDQKVIERDNKKKQICQENKIIIITIPNTYTRRYELIKDLIKKII